MKTLTQFLSETLIRLGSGSDLVKRNIDDFMKEYIKTSDVHPLNNNARLVGHASVHLSPSSRGVHIHDIRSLDQGSGAGTKALKHLTSLADRFNVKLDLYPHGYSNTTTEQLKRWYTRHDFEPNEDDDEHMVRLPR